MGVGQPEQSASAAPASDPDASTRSADVVACALLAALFALFVARSWLAWGHVADDYGREMYVPMRLAAGDVLYRDVRYPYGPLSPYLHAAGYAVFGPRLAVLYASGLAFAAVIVGLLYACARQIATPLAAGLGVALAMLDVMFIPSMPGFSMIFPYAFPALHGLAFAVAALLGGLRLLRGAGVATALATGIVTGLALLTKQEFGMIAAGTCVLAALGVLLLDGVDALRRVLAMIAAAVLTPALGYGALATHMPALDIVRRGLFDPTYFGWPLTWYIAGLRPGAPLDEHVAQLATLYLRSGRLHLAAIAAILCAGVATVLVTSSAARSGAASSPARRGGSWTRWIALAAVIASGVVGLRVLGDAIASGHAARLRYSVFPLLLLVWSGVELCVGLRTRWRDGRHDRTGLARLLLVVVGFVLLARVPGKVVAGDYANFYLFPGIALAAILLVDLVPRALRSHPGGLRVARLTAAAAVAALIVAIGSVRFASWGTRTVDLVTPRGTMRFAPDDLWLPMYVDALDHLGKHTRAGDTVAALPTETAVYFLADRTNHLYETALIANLRTEAEEQAYVAELERDPPRLVLVSTRPQFEYGRGYFGRDFNRTVFAWIERNYRKERTLGSGFLTMDVWVPRPASG